MRTGNVFDLSKLKTDVDVLKEAAETFVGMHNPNQQLQSEPYATLVRNTVNDFIRMEAKGFLIIKIV